MIFTIGYGRHTAAQVIELVQHLDAVLIDVRSLPSSRKPGFSKSALANALGEHYYWAGDLLGGRLPCARQEGIDLLRQFDEHETHHCVLMCAEDAPGTCHRHKMICAPHFPNALHAFNGVLIAAHDLQEAIEADTDDMPFIEDHGLPL